MRAMRTRLSNLSHTVEQQDEAHHQRRRTLNHLYYTDAAAVDGVAVDSDGGPVCAVAEASLTAPSVSLRQRDINVSAQPSGKLGAASSRAGHIDPPCTPNTTARAAAPKSAMRVDTMLQLARQHAPTSTVSEAVASDSASPRAAAPAAQSLARDVVVPVSTTAAPPSPALLPGGFPGLHAYGFQDRFLSPRRREEAHPTHGVALAVPQVPVARTPYTGTHAAYNAVEDDGDASFDAFRVVQERLRQKMRQLTIHPAPPSAPQDSNAAHTVQQHKHVSTYHKASSDADDTSPPPRLPPSRRAETATPNRSQSDNTEAVSASSEAADSPRETVAPRAAEPRHVPRHDACNEDSMEVEVLPHRVLQGTHRSLYDPAEDTVSEMSEVRSAPTPPRAAAERPVVCRAAPRGAFSNPSSSMPPAASLRHRDPLHSMHEYSHGPGSAAAPSRVTMRRSGSGSNGAGEEGRRHVAASSRSAHTGVGAVARRSLSSSQRGSTPSASAPRSSATREGSGSHRSAHQPAAPRTKPISLNVEATILCAVTGAELLALLRMRGLIESEGDTEEYRLPPVRCHRLYVTAEEHRQLQLLRQSLHALAEEEQRQETPSYQRATVSARSRNTEFVPPPTVSRYMGA